MKYMLLAYAAESAWKEEEQAECMDSATKLCHDLASKGQFLGASPLQPVSTATCVRVRGDSRLITDGPFAETTEQLGGFIMVDVESLDVAIAIATRFGASSKGTVEIRPLFELPGIPPAK